MKFQLDHVDECSCVGYAVSNFDLLSELWENTQIQILFKHYSFIVIIICFFSYKLLIRSILHEFNVIYIWRGCCFTVRYFSLCFFDMKLSFFLVVGLGSVEVSDILTYFIVHFSSEKIEWSWIKQSAAFGSILYDSIVEIRFSFTDNYNVLKAKATKKRC